LYVAYHQLESHLLVPRIYGRTLGISPFATLIAALVGWRLLGVVGIVIALPLAAIVPLVEQVWRHEADGRGFGGQMPETGTPEHAEAGVTPRAQDLP
jgi:predicted PurR-regulated permease PerM